jgi:hypothetical protein
MPTRRAPTASVKGKSSASAPRDVAPESRVPEEPFVRVGVTPPPLVQRPLPLTRFKDVQHWLARLMFWRQPLSVRPVGQAQLDARMREVKAGVLHEMQHFGKPLGVPLKTSPFQDILLPQSSQPRRRMAWMIWVWSGFAAVVFIAFLMLLPNPQSGNETHQPTAVVTHLAEAWEAKDARTVMAHLDAAGIARALVAEVKAMEPQVPDNLKSLNSGDAGELLVKEIPLAITAGRPAQGGLLDGLYQAFGGPQLMIGNPYVVFQNSQMAIVELPLLRDDLQKDFALRLVLEPRLSEWVVVKIDGFAGLLQAIRDAEVHHKNPTRLIVGEPIGPRRVETPSLETLPASQSVKLEGVTSMRANDVGTAVFIVPQFRNEGQVALAEIRFNLVVRDYAGKVVLRRDALRIKGPLAVGEVFTRPVRIELNMKSPERFIADVSLQAFKVDVQVIP